MQLGRYKITVIVRRKLRHLKFVEYNSQITGKKEKPNFQSRLMPESRNYPITILHATAYLTVKNADRYWPQYTRHYKCSGFVANYFVYISVKTSTNTPIFSRNLKNTAVYIFIVRKPNRPYQRIVGTHFACHAW